METAKIGDFFRDGVEHAPTSQQLENLSAISALTAPFTRLKFENAGLVRPKLPFIEILPMGEGYDMLKLLPLTADQAAKLSRFYSWVAEMNKADPGSVTWGPKNDNGNLEVRFKSEALRTEFRREFAEL